MQSQAQAGMSGAKTDVEIKGELSVSMVECRGWRAETWRGHPQAAGKQITTTSATKQSVVRHSDLNAVIRITLYPS